MLYSFGIESNQPFHWLEQDGKITGMLALAKESTWTIHASVLHRARNGQLEAIL
ncbi:MAG: hypothetical protein H8E15_03650 [Planctomycetes bacterium]|nr:hypothetical protein [Planctomycetota bacterium]